MKIISIDDDFKNDNTSKITINKYIKTTNNNHTNNDDDYYHITIIIVQCYYNTVQQSGWT